MKSKNNKIGKLEERKVRLIRDIQLCETYKGKIVEFANSLNYQYNKGLINENDYAQQLSEVLENRTLDQWIKYYDECIAYYKNSIDKCDKKIKVEKETETLRKIKSRAELTALTILFALIIIYLGGTFTGFFIAGDINVPVYDKFGEVIGKSTVNDGLIFANTYDGLISVIIEPTKITDLSRIIISGGKVRETQDTIIYLGSIEGRITITIPRDRLLTGIARCSSFDIGGFYCREWKETPTVLKYEGEKVSFDVSTEGAYAGIFNSSELDPSNIEIRVKNKFGNNLSSPKIEGKTVTINTNDTELNLTGIISTKVDVFIDRVGDKIIKTPIVYIPSITLNKSVVSLPKNEKQINAIYKCDTFDLGAFKCLEWKKANITFEDRGDHIVFEADSFSGFGGGFIPIAKAEHLDENRLFIEDIYDLVKARDYIWTNEIPVGHYVRVRFEDNLSKDNDITIYARSVNSGSIEVYEEGLDKIITTFENIEIDKKYKVLLSNLEGFQNTFDLKIVGGGIEFDHIIDPTVAPGINFTFPTPPNGTSSTDTNLTINLTIDDHLMKEIKFNFNYTNYTMINDSLEVMMNFDNRTSLGETDTTIFDVSGNGHNGTAQSGAFVNLSGRYGAAFQFDGVNDYISIPHDAGLEFGNMSVTAWINRVTNTTTDAIVDKMITQSGSVRYGWVVNASGFLFFYHDSVGSYHQYNTLTDAKVGTPSTWYYVALTYTFGEGNSMKIYVNGNLTIGRWDSGTGNGSAGSSTRELWIGKQDHTTFPHPFDGLIDELKMWNRTLTADEINFSYQTNLYKFNNSQWHLLVNKTGLAIGSYNYSASATDQSNNENQTELRKYTVISPVSCGNITTSTTMTQNLTAPGTCFNITASNVELNCAGFNITYAINSAGRGINISGQALTGITVKNCPIFKGSTQTTNADAIYINAENSTIINNSILSQANGINIDTSANISIINNTIDSVASGFNPISSLASVNLTIINNTLIGESSSAILLTTTPQVNITSNRMNTTNGFILDISDASSGNNTIKNNIIEMTVSGVSNGVDGIGVSSTGNIIESNNITLAGRVNPTTQQDVVGIHIKLNACCNTVLKNNITLNDTAIFIQNANYNLILENFLKANGSAIAITGRAHNNSITNNTIDYAVDAFKLTAAGANFPENNNFTNNTIKYAAGMELNISTQMINGTNLINQPIRNYTINGTVNFFNQTFGNIRFFKPINGTGPSLFGFETSIIRIGNNSFFVNDTTTDLVQINTSANITILGSPGITFTAPIIYRTNFACNATVGVSCFNYTSLKAATVIFNVTGFSNYSVLDNASVAAGNNDPSIRNVSAIAAVDPVENSNRSVNFSFVASDPDGVADLNDSTALAIFNKTGEASRNASCTVGEDINANSVNYTCAVNMWYFDGSGSWNVNVSVSDVSGARAENSTTAGNMTGISFTFNALTAFIMNPTSLTWGTLNVVDTNQTSNNDPLGLNNTGNVDIANITVNATDLTGETDSAFRIYAENFTVANLTGGSPANECDFNTNATIPRRGQDTQINKTLLGRGNNSIAT
ncbi:right-handed parallel beta-helix repeat-containing protein, partial [Candidatus Woesearchaeota archaeon]|nr:right-handed parallel beta-helix repeat-containing protein [Candidatus Woesearchaeota archaeon]